MAKHVGYINPTVQKMTTEMLAKYKEEHPESVTPMADAFKVTNSRECDRTRFVRSARALGWSVSICRGNCYENGVFVWGR